MCAFIREQVSAGERMRGLERGKESARVRKGGIAGAVGQQMAGGDPETLRSASTDSVLDSCGRSASGISSTHST